jgi:hypothetical protein
MLPAATRWGGLGWPQVGASVRQVRLAGAAVLTGLLGVLLGTAPSGIEPGGEWVYCGRALFHDRSRLSHPDCAASYEPFESAAIALLLISVILLFLVPFQRADRTGTGHPQPVRDTPSPGLSRFRAHLHGYRENVDDLLAPSWREWAWDAAVWVGLGVTVATVVHLLWDGFAWHDVILGLVVAPWVGSAVLRLLLRRWSQRGWSWRLPAS